MRSRHPLFRRTLGLYTAALSALALIGFGVVNATLYLGQRYLLFENALYGNITSPARIGMPDISVVQVTTTDGLDLSIWYKKASPGCPTIVYFHGNDGDVRSRAFKMEPFLSAGWGGAFAEYRGYGGNPGIPSETGLYEDARATIRYLSAERVPSEEVFFLGESLGSGVAVKMAEELAPAGLILLAPYTSISDVAQFMYWFLPAGLLTRDSFPSISRIGYVHKPVLIIHGEQDKTIPVALARKLLAAAAEPKEGVFIPGAGHDNLFAMGAIDAIADFVEHPPQCRLATEQRE